MSDLKYKIQLDTKSATLQVKNLDRNIKNFSNNLKKNKFVISQQSKEILKLNTSFFTLKTTLGALASSYVAFESLSKITNVTMDFEAQIDRLGAISNATGDELKKLEATALKMGETTQYSATEASKGLEFLAMAGFDVSEQIKAIPSVLNLATIGMVDLSTSSDIASNILSGFGKEADELENVVDIMTATITNSNTNIVQMGEAMKYVAPQAKAMGVDIREVSTAIGVMGNSGMQGSIAGTTLNQMLIRMASQTPKAKKQLEQLNITLFDSKGKFIGLKKSLIELQKGFKDLNQQQKIIAVKDIFGVEASKGVLTLLDNIGDGYDKLASKIANSSGIASKTAKTMQDNLKGAYKELQSALESLMLTVGKDLLPALTEGTKSITDFIRAGKDWYSENNELIKGFGKLILELYALKKVIDLLKWTSLITGSSMLLSPIVALFGALGKLRVAIMAINPALAIVTGAVIAMEYALSSWKQEIELSNKATENFNAKIDDFKKIIDDLGKKLNKNTKEFQLSKEEVKKYSDNITSLIDKNKKLIEQWEKKDPEKYKLQIEGLTKQNQVLIKYLEKVKNIKPFEGKSKEIGITKEATKQLTEENKKYLDSIEKSNQKRLLTAENTINTLKAKETNLTQDLIKLEEELLQIRQDYSNKRILLVDNYENRLKNVKGQDLSEIEKYKQAQIDAENAFNNAQLALKNKNFNLSKQYLDKYNKLIDSYAGKEIKVDDKVYISKAQNLATYEKQLQNAKALDLELLAAEENKEIELHNQKITHKKIELEALKAQIQVQLQIIELTKKMIETATGQKIDMDFSSTKKTIENIDKQIENLQNQMKQPINSTYEVNSNIDNVLNLKSELSKDTFSTHTIATKRVSSGVTSGGSVGGFSTATTQVSSTTSNYGGSTGDDNFDKQWEQWVKDNNLEGQYLATGGGVGIGEFTRLNGKIGGYDPLSKDDVPAMLSRGEFVHKNETVKHYGTSTMEAINNMQIPKEVLSTFANGGIVEQALNKDFIVNYQPTSNISKPTNTTPKKINSDKTKQTNNKKTPSPCEVAGAYTNQKLIDMGFSSLEVANFANIKSRMCATNKEIYQSISNLKRASYFQTVQKADRGDSIARKKLFEASPYFDYKLPEELNYKYPLSKVMKGNVQIAGDYAGLATGGLVMPKTNIPKYATGGEVSNQTNRTVDINFNGNFGEKMTTSSDEMTALQLEAYFKKFEK